MTSFSLIPLAFALAAAPASAQNIFPAQRAGSQPIIERNDTGFSRCGIRVVLRDEAGKVHDFYDIDVNVFPPQDAGVIQLTRISKTEAQLANGSMKPQGPAPVKFWIAGATDAKRLTALEYVDSETPGKMSAITSTRETHQMIIDIANGKRMQFAARYPKQAGADRVISFAAPLPEADMPALDACLQSMPD